MCISLRYNTPVDTKIIFKRPDAMLCVAVDRFATCRFTTTRLVMVVSVRARANKLLWLCVCVSVVPCLPCWNIWNNIEHMYRAYQANVYNWIERMECACVCVRHARMLCICGLFVCVYVCFIRQRIMLVLIQAYKRYVSSNCLCTFYIYIYICMLLLTFSDAGWRFCSSNSDHSKYKHSVFVRCKQMLSKLTQAPKPVLIERREKEEKKQSRIKPI